MRSKINPDMTFLADQCVISLVRHNQHAIIIRENYSASGEHEIKKIDFVPYGKSYCFLYGADLGQMFFSQTSPGLVQIQDFKHKQKTIPQCSMEDIFTQLKLAHEAVSWLTSVDNVRLMMQKIQIEHGDKSKTPVFNIKGKVGEIGSGHNCCTWAIERLKMIPGIDAATYLSGSFFAYTLNLPKVSMKNNEIELIENYVLN